MPFLQNEMKNTLLDNVVSIVFPNLSYKEKNFLNTYLIKLIEYIALKFNFLKNELYYNQLFQNDYQDAKGLLLLLLPYISETEKPRASISSLNDLYTEKNSITKKYIYTNIQYNRCIPKNRIEYEEQSFNKSHIVENYLLLRNTIYKISNKLYVNWIDIRPTIMENNLLTDIPLYRYTIEGFKKNKIVIEDPYDDNIMEEYGGLSIQDIYEVISNKLYYEIKDIKWIIFDYSVSSGKNVLYFGYLLNIILPLTPIVKGTHYNMLEQKDRDEFNNKWRSLVSQNIYTIVKDSKTWAVIKMVTYYFNKYYFTSETVDFMKFEIKEDIDPDETFSRTTQYDNTIYNTLQSIKATDMYNFLYDQLRIFEKTWYCKKMASFSENKDNYFSKNILLEKESNKKYTLTFKNIYNYSKLFCAIVDSKKDKDDTKSINDLKFYPKYWTSIDTEARKIIIRKLYYSTSDGDNGRWFNIGRYIKTTYKDTTSQGSIAAINSEIYELVKKNIIKIVFEALIFSGHLSTFTPSPDISNNINLSKDEEEKGRQIQQRIGELIIQPNRDLYENSYYFLTGRKYSDSIIKYNEYKNNKDQYAETTYISAISSPHIKMGGWNNTYAMNWISQIGFFHKYINNRVLYVTGGTGVGKSTQVPKLLLYGLSMIDYNNNGKILCSQPRIPPTEDNAEIISMQLGVPIKDYNQTYNRNIKSNNYYVTYSHKKDSHSLVSNDIPMLQLSIVTDGKLLETTKRYPLMKYTTPTNTYVADKNVCDIVIVDEAHEHNKNMDFILTIMRNAAFYNNSIKLVIISATMDDDEYTYRRYYRDINDNIKYPLNIDIKKKLLDRINVDRRIHISPPSAPTRFTIVEHYEPDMTPEDIVLKILNTTKSGDIILFQPGKEEIKKSRDILNSKMQSNVIALPFYSELEEKKALVIKKMDDEKKYKLQLARNIPYERSTDKDNTVSKGTYTRVVIIATNIAEASITINSLRYVVDTGTEKTSRYDYVLNKSVIELGTISDSSRLQRKGRVGRVAPGVVYYNYIKGMTENNKKKYGISVQSIGDSMFSMLKDPSDKLLIDRNSNFSKGEYKNSDNTNVDGIDIIYKNLYTISGVPYEYYGVESALFTMSNIPNIYQKGYDIKSITDDDGTFYIVHPNELDFKRNILGTIIGKDSDNDNKDNKYSKTAKILEYDGYTNTIVSYKMLSFWKFMIDNELVYMHSDGNPIKTEYGIFVQNIQSKLVDYVFEEIITLVYANKYGVLSEVFFIIVLLKSVDYLVSGLTNSVMIFDFFNNYKNITSDNSDITSVKIICNKIMKFVNNELKIGLKLDISNDLQIIKNGYINNNYGEIDYKIYEKVSKLFFSNKLNINNPLDELEIKFMLTDISKAIIKLSVNRDSEDKLRVWCENNFLNFGVVWRSINFYFNNINDLVKEFKSKTNENVIKNIIVPHIDVNDGNRINYPFIKGFIGNISKKINGSQHFINFLKPDLNAIYSISAIRIKLKNSRFTKMLPNSLVDTRYSDYIIYLGFNGIKNLFTMVIPIRDLSILKILCPKIFTTGNFNTNFDYLRLTFIEVVDRNLYETMIKMTNDYKTICNNI